MISLPSEGGCTLSKTITLRLSDEHYEVFKKYAQMDNRKISNAIETLALKQLERVRSIDEQEMKAVLADKDLVARIRAGAKQAKERRGRFVKN
jgi:hypothetical protein